MISAPLEFTLSDNDNISLVGYNGDGSYKNLYKLTKANNSQRLAIINCCSAVNKHVDLEVFLKMQNIHLVMGTESHLDGAVFDSEVFPSNYTVYRKDRNIHGGGIFVLVEKSIPSSVIETDSPCEIIWVRLYVQNTNDVILDTPPHSPVSI